MHILAKKMIYFTFSLLVIALVEVNSQYAYPQNAIAAPTGISGLSSQFFLSVLRGLPRDPPVCNFGCPMPGQYPTPRAYHVPQSNGCGSYGFERIFVPETDLFVDCCNTHDICYDTCGTTKAECDYNFHTCILQRCSNLQLNYALPSNLASNCMSTAQLLGTAPVVAGCNAFIIAQTNACECLY